MPYVEDEFGEWWYVARNYRTRAYPRVCERCAAQFYARRCARTRHCSKRCALMEGRHPSWRGGRTVQKGYVLVRAGDDPIALAMASNRGYVPEHRLVIARALGRPISSDEHVHHINGDKQDTRLDNLELLTHPHGPGIRLQCGSCGSHDIRPVLLRADDAGRVA